MSNTPNDNTQSLWLPGTGDTTTTRKNVSTYNAYREQARLLGNYGTPHHGGFLNTTTGSGTSIDHAKGGRWTPTRVDTGAPLEVIYNESWACRKYIDIPVDDMTVRWREWDAAGQSGVTMMEQEESLELRERITEVIKAARLYGSALLIIVTRNQKLSEPLIPEAVLIDDLINLLVVDRYHASVNAYDTNIYSPTYGEPLSYLIDMFSGFSSLQHALGGRLGNADPHSMEVVDRSRVIRFDGIPQLTRNRYSNYDPDWGISLIVPAIKAIIDDQTVASGAAHLADEASVPVMKVQGMQEGYASRARTAADPDIITPDEMASMVSTTKSIYRTVFLDAADEFERVNVSWGGLAEVMNQFAQRLAAIADVPQTRFWGRSPMGMNATGESDMANYALHVAAMQKKMLTAPLKKLDVLLSMNAGIGNEPPEYHFPSLMDIGDLDKSTIASTKATSVQTLITAGVITEDEGRKIIDGDDIFGDLPGNAPGQPMLDAPMAPFA